MTSIASTYVIRSKPDGSVIRMPEMRERFAAEVLEVVGGPPESFGAFLQTEIDKYARVIKAAGITPQ